MLQQSIMKKIGLLIAVLLMVISFMPRQGIPFIGASQTSAARSFPDVTTFQKEIEFLADRKIIKGFPNGHFKPTATITRLDAVRMILREMNSEKEVIVNPGFSDVKPGAVGYEEVALGVELGFIQGKETRRGEKYFDPKGALTRAEMAKILTEAYNLRTDHGISFNDVNQAHWANSYISRLATANITNGFPGGTFKPQEPLQRQHFAGFMARLLAPADFPITPTLPTKPMIYMTTDQLNMRSKAGVNHPVVGSIPYGKTVTFLEKSSNWYKVQYETTIGWVNSAYLSDKIDPYPKPTVGTKGTYVTSVLIVNKTYSLPSNHNPGVDKWAQQAANAMVSQAEKQGISLTAFSTFRSYSYQQELYNSYVRKHGVVKANRFSAKPGYSEHQTGLAFDFGGNDRSKWLEESFETTREAKWLLANASDYGFILRYPKGKEKITGYMYEPWHYRYLGSDLAKKVKKSGKTLEEYVEININ